MSSATVATIVHGEATYEVKRISAEPELYVAYVTSPHLPIEAIHRDGRTYGDALRTVAAHIEAYEATRAAVIGSLGRRHLTVVSVV